MVSEQHICWGAGHKHESSHELKLEHLSLYYGTTPAIKDISFSICCGQSLALIGPNGAGKSTLLSAIAGILKYSQGRITWDGKALPRHEIAYIPQRSEVDWEFPITVRQLVELGRYPSLGIWKSEGKHDRDIVDKALDSLELNELQNRQIGSLSGGQQQRAFLARALAQEAHILLLDEPFTGLDRPGEESLSKLLKQLSKEGRLIIASHHDLNTAAQIFDQALLLNCKQIAFGASEAVLCEDILAKCFQKREPEGEESSKLNKDGELTKLNKNNNEPQDCMERNNMKPHHHADAACSQNSQNSPEAIEMAKAKTKGKARKS